MGTTTNLVSFAQKLVGHHSQKLVHVLESSRKLFVFMRYFTYRVPCGNYWPLENERQKNSERPANSIFTNNRPVVLFCLSALVIFLMYQYPLIHMQDPIPVSQPFEALGRSRFLQLNGTIQQLGAANAVFIINLPRRTDRRTGSIALFQTLDLAVKIVPAYDFHSPAVSSRSYLLRKGHLTQVELACWASHMRIWLEAARHKNDTWVVIFEDDIDLEMSTVDILASFPPDLWSKPDMIYFGYCGNPPGAVLYEGIDGYRVHRAIHPSCTHAYAIRSQTASKLSFILSSPVRAIDDEIVRLVENEKLLVFSIHPPLAVQQSLTSSSPSDVNPVKKTWSYRMRISINHFVEWWRGVQIFDRLRNSTLARADFGKADQWRRQHEKNN